MDSFTHLFIGGAIAAALAPPAQRRAALLAGAALNSLPDLDVLPLFLTDDPVIRMTWHRAATHSLLVLPLVGLLLWAWFRSRGGRVAAAPTRWFWIIQLCLLTHPLIDACTVYGTQLWWPLPVPPVMWSTLFIIDPMLTVPLVIGCVVAAWFGARPQAQRALVASLAIAVGYVGWSFVAKAMVEREAQASLAAIGLGDAPPVLGADAVQHAAVARGGDDAGRVRRRRSFACRRPRADPLHALSVRHARAGRRARRTAGRATVVVQPPFRESAGARRQTGAHRSADGVGAGLQLPFRDRQAAMGSNGGRFPRSR